MAHLKIPSKSKLIEAAGRGRMMGPIWPVVVDMLLSIKRLYNDGSGDLITEWYLDERLMPGLNSLIGGHGVEQLQLVVRKRLWTIHYVNMGDSYSTTVLCWTRRDGLMLDVKLEIGSWGDLAEKWDEPKD